MLRPLLGYAKLELHRSVVKKERLKVQSILTRINSNIPEEKERTRRKDIRW